MRAHDEEGDHDSVGYTCKIHRLKPPEAPGIYCSDDFWSTCTRIEGHEFPIIERPPPTSGSGTGDGCVGKKGLWGNGINWYFHPDR